MIPPIQPRRPWLCPSEKPKSKTVRAGAGDRPSRGGLDAASHSRSGLGALPAPPHPQFPRTRGGLEQTSQTLSAGPSGLPALETSLGRWGPRRTGHSGHGEAVEGQGGGGLKGSTWAGEGAARRGLDSIRRPGFRRPKSQGRGPGPG